jgi:hypothetical protein
MLRVRDVFRRALNTSQHVKPQFFFSQQQHNTHVTKKLQVGKTNSTLSRQHNIPDGTQGIGIL